MKSSKSILALVVLSLASAGFVFAAAESKAGKCCVKAAGDGKACAHPCCVEAAKAGDNCTKCGGAGKIATKANKK